jgi:hypothetical protein
MTQYLLSVYEPTGSRLPPPAELDQIMKAVDAINEQLKSAGAWVFAGGLHGPESSTVLRAHDGQVLTTDGPFIEAKEHLGGFTIIEAPDLDAALDWGRQLSEATTLPVEVRPFQSGPPILDGDEYKRV